MIICLINPLDGLLVRSYYGICTSGVSFVNAFRHCRVITADCVRTVSRYAAMVAAGAKPCTVEPLRASLRVLPWPGNDKSCSSVLLAAMVATDYLHIVRRGSLTGSENE